MAKVALCDDHGMFMYSQQRVLETMGHQVMGCLGNGRDIVEFYKQTPVDLVVMDISMPIANGMTGLKRLREISWEVKVIMLSMYEDMSWIARAMVTGANGYLTKTVQPKEFAQAVTVVLAGGMYSNVELGEEYLAETQKALHYLAEPVLSTRECEVLQLIGEGYSHKQIAAELNLSIHTIRDHQEHVKKVTRCKTTADLVKLAVRRGLVPL